MHMYALKVHNEHTYVRTLHTVHVPKEYSTENMPHISMHMHISEIFSRIIHTHMYVCTYMRYSLSYLTKLS